MGAVLLPEVEVRGRPRPARARYWYILSEDYFVAKFCVAGAVGPNTVHTLAPDGTQEYWEQREEGDVLVFYPPSGYAGSQGLLWAYDKRLQHGEPMPRAELERRALEMRKSVAF